MGMVKVKYYHGNTVIEGWAGVFSSENNPSLSKRYRFIISAKNLDGIASKILEEM